jgi:hypothetical protein
LNCFGINLPVFHGEGIKDGMEWIEESGIELMWFIFEIFFKGFGINFDKAVGYVKYFFFMSLKGLHSLDQFGVVVEEGLELVLLFL